MTTIVLQVSTVSRAGKCGILKLRRKSRKKKKKSVEENQHDKLKQLREENLRLKTELEQINKELHELIAKFDINSSFFLYFNEFLFGYVFHFFTR